ncbi:MAG TPA: hypothetical protein VFC78_17585 [Tepidisphaeraceae bacterium]|nr:hypothetical protein [Tepidisphaeraceae bacterium]
MNISRITILGVALGVATSWAQRARPSATAPRTTVEELFSKEISPGQRIVVTRQSFDAKSLGKLGAIMATRGSAVGCIRVELRVGEEPTVLLGSMIESDMPHFPLGLTVIDVFHGDEDVVVACTMEDLVGLWRISTDLQTRLPAGWTWLRPGQYAAALPLGRDKVSVEMTPIRVEREPERWSLKITDKRGVRPETIRLEQANNAWSFAVGDSAVRPIKGGN